MADESKSADTGAPIGASAGASSGAPSDPVESAIASAAASGRKRRPPTIDLTATDTTPDSKMSDATKESDPPPPDAVIETPAGPSTETSADSPTAADAATVAADETMTASSDAHNAQTPTPPAAHRTSFGGAFAAGALGAVLMLVVLGMLWVAGLFGDDATLLSERTSRLETQLRSLGERPATATSASSVDVGKINDLTKRIAALEAKPAATSAGNPSTAAAPDAALAGRIATLEGTLKTLSSRLDATANTAREAVAQSATPAVPPAEVEALSARVASLDSGVKALQADVAKRFAAGLNDPAARRAVTAEALRVAVERGDAFVEQLKAAQPLAKDNALAALQAFAPQGVPTAAALSRELVALLPALRAAQPSAQNADAGFMQRLASNAEKLVRVRPVDEAAGDDPAALLSRVEARAHSADIDGALAELNKLPAETRAPADAWMKKAQARRDAVQAARQFAAASLNQLTP